MKLDQLLRAIESSPVSVTVPDLSRQLGATPEEVRAMLLALRAVGKLRPGTSRSVVADTERCPGAGFCSAACPGPDECPWAVESAGGLEIRILRAR